MVQFYRYLFIIIQINSIASQTCRNDIPDFFFNVDFAGPFFDQAVYTRVNFPVSTPIGSPVVHFTLSPQTKYTRPSYSRPNQFGSRTLLFSLENISVRSSDPNFIVGGSNGNYTLYTNTSPLIYFSPFNRYLFNLIAEQRFPDQERPPAVSTAIVQINLQNDNVNSPIFIPENQTFYISESASPSTEFGVVYAIDADNDGIIYSVTDPRFSIDPSTGVLRLKRAFPSLPSPEYLDIVVTATDDRSSCSSDPCNERSTSTRIRIIVTGINRNSPIFLNDICGKEISLRENNTIGTPILSLTAWDEDQGDNGLIDIAFPAKQLRTVSGLMNRAYSQFHLELMGQTNTTRTAILKANQTFDYDTPGAPRFWFIYILATDNGKPKRQGLCTLRINLIDVNDNSPEFIMPSWNYTIYSSLFVPTNPRFLRLIASDADSNPNDRIHYYIGTRDVPYFAMERETGTIILRNNITDINSLNISRFPIRFEVYAQDLGIPPRFSTNNATVTIYYSDSTVPVVSKWFSNYGEELHVDISEKFYEQYPNQPINQNGGFNGSIYFESSSEISPTVILKSPFSYDTSLPFTATSPIKNGNIFRSDIIINSPLDAEIRDSYFLYIRVIDPPLFSSIRIKLNDENDQPPTFDINSIELSVLENENGYRTLGQIQASDLDIDHENTRVLYARSVTSTDTVANARFTVYTDGTIWTNTTFVKENNRTGYQLNITAFNEKPEWGLTSNLTTDFQVFIRLVSVNNNYPRFLNDSFSMTIGETKRGIIISNIIITDADNDKDMNLGILSGDIRNAFTFTLSSTNLNDSSRTQYVAIGQLNVIGPLNYESIPSYTLVLFAFDGYNFTTISVTVNLQSENTRAPIFDLMPGFLAYEYVAIENTAQPVLNGPGIGVISSNSSSSRLPVYEIYDPRYQLNLVNLYLSQTNDRATLRINAPGLSRDLPFGSSEYRFAIRVTNENGAGVSSYAQVSIQINDTNNRAPIPTSFSCIPQGINSTISITFEDYDDPTASNTIPFIITVVPPSNLTLVGPTLGSNRAYAFIYNGLLNRTLTKNFTVTFNASDNNRYFESTTISIIVCDGPFIYPISNGSKRIKVIYVKDYQNSLRDIDLGSIYVQDLNDWYRVNRIYSIRSVSNNQSFSISQGFLRTSSALQPGSSTVLVDVTKPEIGSSALSTIHLDVESIDSERVRNAVTIRIQGEYPETIVDSLLDKLHQALASILNINRYSITFLSIRSVLQYRNPYDRPISLESQKQQALTDVIFSVFSSDRSGLESRLKANLNQFQSRFQIQVVAIAPDPCQNYGCPMNTRCRATRIIQPKPYTIDTNQTSFVGINILDSPDCVYAINSVMPSVSTSNLGLVFTGHGDGYAVYDDVKFSNIAPTRFSFDFATQSITQNALLLLYGGDLPPENNFFWIATEIFQSKLIFHFRNTTFIASETVLNNSKWYHVECQFIHSTILLSINDCQYQISVDDTTTTNNYTPSIRLYLGGLPNNGSIISHLYPSLNSVNSFTGCIRNVLSNGYYLDMSDSLSRVQSAPGECPCIVTDSCLERRLSDVIIPWYTWLIMALVFLLLAMIISLTVLTCIRRKQQMKRLKGLYVDETRESIIDYKDAAGEEDHATYNLYVLKKPIFMLSDGNSLPNRAQSDYTDSRLHNRPPLGDFIEEKLDEHVIPYANDTQLHYLYEGDNSIASNLSSIESPSSPHENEHQYLQSLGPKFSTVADFYADL